MASNAPVPTLTIGQAAKQAGVRPSALRYYEQIGLLPPAYRVHGQRRYDADVVRQIALIQTAQDAGFSLAEMKILFNEILSPGADKLASQQWQILVRSKLREVEKRLSQVQQMRELLEDVMQCNEPQLADCIYVTGQRHAFRG